MATKNNMIVRCPVYLSCASKGEKPGCGSTDVKRISLGITEFECASCGDWFGSTAVEFDRKVLADPWLRAQYDSRLAATGLY